MASKGEPMKGKTERLYAIVKPWYTVLLRLLYHPKWIGKENIPEEGPIVIAANHKMAFDPLLVLTATKRQVSYLAKSDLFRGIPGWFFRNMGMIPVYRDKGNMKAVLEAEEVLRKGGAIGIFPEGKRNYTQQELLPFRTGAVRLAKQVVCPIVPCAITGKYRLFRKGIQIEFGKPISIENFEIKDANQILQEEIRKLLRK